MPLALHSRNTRSDDHGATVADSGALRKAGQRTTAPTGNRRDLGPSYGDDAQFRMPLVSSLVRPQSSLARSQMRTWGD